MARFIEGADRRQVALLPESLDDYVGADNPVRVVDAFVDALDLAKLGFDGVAPEATGRPGYHPATLLKIYLYGYLNQVQSSRRLERECGRNLELIWLTGRLAPDFGATTARPSARFAPASSHSAGPASARWQRGRDRRQQVQGGEPPREELYEGSIGEADRGHREHHRPLSQ